MILLEKEINRKFFRLVPGSIIEETSDAIVNPANEQLSHGGGVAGLIARAGGEKIRKESRTKAPVPTGSAVWTSAGKLPCKYVIHTVGPVYKGGDHKEPELLRSAVTSALEIAAELRLASISLPSISTGIFGYPLEPAIRIIVTAIFEFMEKDTSLQEIRLCEVDPAKAEQIRQIIA